MTYAAASLSGKPADRPNEFEFVTANIHHANSPDFYRYGLGQTEEEFGAWLVTEFEQMVQSLGGSSKVAAFFAEPTTFSTSPMKW